MLLIVLFLLTLLPILPIDAKIAFEQNVFKVHTATKTTLPKEVEFKIEVAGYSLEFKKKKNSFLSDFRSSMVDNRPLEYYFEGERDCNAATGDEILIIPTEAGVAFDLRSGKVEFPDLLYSIPHELSSWVRSSFGQDVTFPIPSFYGSFIIRTAIEKEALAAGYCYDEGENIFGDPFYLAGQRNAGGSKEYDLYNRNTMTKLYRITKVSGKMDICVVYRSKCTTDVKVPKGNPQ